jgi:hypothetical protein
LTKANEDTKKDAPLNKSNVEGRVIELLIIAGDDPKEILEYAAKDVENNFCKYPEEFEEEWGREGKNYKITLKIEEVL